MYFSPMHKGKNLHLYGKGSARAELAEMEDGEFAKCQMAIFWIRRIGNQAAKGPPPLAWEGIFYISSLRPTKNIFTKKKKSRFPKHLENAGYFSRVVSFYHKLFIFNPSSWQCWNKNIFFLFHLPSINCQVWKIPTFSPQNFSRPADKAIYPPWLTILCIVVQSYLREQAT